MSTRYLVHITSPEGWELLRKFGSRRKAEDWCKRAEKTDPALSDKLPANDRQYLSIEEE